MLISLNWLREIVEVKASVQDIADKLSVSGLEVEHLEVWESVKGGLKGFVVGEVISCAKHPNADKLSVTTVDIGVGELQPIVCGAPNVAVGQKVIVATVGTEVTVPGKGSFTIGEAKIRGEVSRGMICAEDEIGIGNSHDGILVLPAQTPVGIPAADYFEVVTDHVMEIGLTANRGDAASHLGVARDVAALFGTTVIMPNIPAIPLATGPIKISINNPEWCSVYDALFVNDIAVTPSSATIQNRLKAIGIEPKNNLVDATNYTLHTLGQPVHAFDADKLRGGTLEVRLAAKGETFTTLDKISRECKGGELVIADGAGIVAFAGVMGGLDSAVTEATTNVVIESAHFNPSLVRKTARAHGLSTDASFRFERSTDPQLCSKAALFAAQTMLATGGGECKARNLVETKPFEAVKVTLDLTALNAFAGMEIEKSIAVSILKHLGFEVSGSGSLYEVTVPSWRNDVAIAADLYEEIMRIYGYDNIPMSGKMKVSLPAFKGTDGFKKQEMASRFLTSQGFFEIMNNSLTSARFYGSEMLENMVSLTNPLSADMEWMRASLLPGMLQAAAYNRNRKNNNIRFFEFGRVYTKKETGFRETEKLGILVGGDVFEESWEEKSRPMDYYYARRMVENLLRILGVTKFPEIAINGVSLADKKAWDLSGDFWYAEVDWKTVLKASKQDKTKVVEPPRFPFMRRDLSLVVDKSMTFANLEAVIKKQQQKLLKKINVFDVFEGKPLEQDKKAVAIAFYLGKEEETLTDEQADAAMNKLIGAFEAAGAVIRR